MFENLDVVIAPLPEGYLETLDRPLPRPGFREPRYTHGVFPASQVVDGVPHGDPLMLLTERDAYEYR